MSTLDRCPGNELNKSATMVICTCDSCGKENEIFSDEVDKKQKCVSCGKPLDMSKCSK